MNEWLTFGKDKVIESKPSVFKEYIIPLGSLFLAIVPLFAQDTPPAWVNVAIAIFVAIVFFFLVVPMIAPVWRKLRTGFAKRRSGKQYLPKVFDALRKFAPMLDSHRADTIWEAWQSATQDAAARELIRPSPSHLYTLSNWLGHLSKTTEAAAPQDLALIAAETASWVQQYSALCRDAFSQFENLLRVDAIQVERKRAIKQSWNHARDAHNQVVCDWKALAEEINKVLGENACPTHYDTLKPLE